MSPKSTLYTNSISDLHVLKEHPVLLNNYFNNKNNLIKEDYSIIKKILNYLKNLLFGVKNFSLNNFHKNGSEILILSNIINEKHILNKDDFYFGDLEKLLNIRGYKTFTALRNFTGNKYNYIKLKLPRNKILLSETTFLHKEIYFIFKVLYEYLFIKLNFKKPNIQNLNSKFLSFLSFKSLISNLRLSSQIKSLIRIIKPKLIIITFEGHAWERVLIKTIKEINPNIKVGFYQFTSITKYQHSIFRKLKSGYNPDIIFTSGYISKKKFKKKFSSPVEVIGSIKSINVKNRSKRKNLYRFLILPEAFKSETQFLFNFAKNCAKLYPQYEFVFKSHPMMNSVISKEKTYKNFKISKKNLNDEIKNSSYVIFRGSASVYQAVSSGCLPIYLSNKNEMTINPLSEVHPKYLSISNPKDLMKIVKSKKYKKNNEIINYCTNYFVPLDERPIISYLKKMY